MAQLVERLVRNEKAAGSNPTISTIKETSFVHHDKRGFFCTFLCYNDKKIKKSTNRDLFKEPDSTDG